MHFHRIRFTISSFNHCQTAGNNAFKPVQACLRNYRFTFMRLSMVRIPQRAIFHSLFEEFFNSLHEIFSTTITLRKFFCFPIFEVCSVVKKISSSKFIQFFFESNFYIETKQALVAKKNSIVFQSTYYLIMSLNCLQYFDFFHRLHTYCFLVKMFATAVCYRIEISGFAFFCI